MREREKIAQYRLPPNHRETNVEFEQLRNIIKGKKNTAPGPDGILYKILKHLPVMKEFCEIIQSSLTKGIVPDCWKKSNVSMLPKPNKDHSQLKNYRPLALTSCIGKLCEVVIKEHLNKHCECNDIFTNAQGAYRTGRSTTDNLLCLSKHIFNDALWKQPTAAAFLDIQQAFDAVWHKGLIYKMQLNNMPELIIKWTVSYLKDQELTVIYQRAVANSFKPSAGVPQGSVIGPTLFNIYVSSPGVSNAKVSQYADDIAIYTSGRKCKAAAFKLQKALNSLGMWCNLWKIKINPEKTNFMLLTRNRDKSHHQLKLQDVILNPSKTTTFLGVELNDNLAWAAQIRRIEKKMYGRINGLMMLKAKGVNSKCLIMLYRATIRPIMEYASPAWANAPKHSIMRLQLQQNKAIRLALDLPRWTSSEELHNAANLPRVSTLLAQRNIQYLKRASNNNAAIRELIQDQLTNTTTELQYTTPVKTILFETAKNRLCNMESP